MRLYILIALIITGCTPCLIGSGDVISETRSVGSFKDIEITGSGNLFITQGEDSPLRIEAEDNIMPQISTRVIGDKLTIDIKGCINAREPINYYVSMSDAEKIIITGSGSINSDKLAVDELEMSITGSGDINTLLDVDRLSVIISGSGTAFLTGSADDFTSSISGSGNINAFDLVSKDVVVRHSGSGSHQVYASDTLDIVISGSGNVQYKGDASVNSEVSGSGSVKKL